MTLDTPESAGDTGHCRAHCVVKIRKGGVKHSSKCMLIAEADGVKKKETLQLNYGTRRYILRHDKLSIYRRDVK